MHLLMINREYLFVGGSFSTINVQTVNIFNFSNLISKKNFLKRISFAFKCVLSFQLNTFMF